MLTIAASHYDRGIAEWRTFAAASFAYAHATLRQVALETHHSFGAIGYAEDHEAPRHFKRTPAIMSAIERKTWIESFGPTFITKD